MFDFEQLTEEETERASEIMQRLFAEKCIVPAKDRTSKEDFEFVHRHKDYFEDLMARCGFKMRYITVPNKEVITFQAESSANQMRLKKQMSMTIVYLRYRYEEITSSVSRAMVSESQEVIISVTELLNDIIADKKGGYALNYEKELMGFLRKLEQYNLVELRMPRGGKPEEQTIRILPSIRVVLEKGTVETLYDLLQSYYNETSGRKKKDIAAEYQTEYMEEEEE